MSANELSTLIKRHILPALEKDLRPQLNAAVQDLEIDPKTTKTNIREHFQCSRQQANKVFNFIIQDIISYKDKTTGQRMFQSRPASDTGGRKWVFSFGGYKKVQVKGKGWVESQLPLASRYSKFVKWKSDLGPKLEERFKDIDGIKDFSKTFDLGHGSSMAAVGYRAASAVDSLTKEGGAGAEHLISAIIRQQPLFKDVDLHFLVESAFDTNGRIKKDYVVWLDLQYSKENRQQGQAIEELANRKLKEFFNGIINTPWKMDAFLLNSGSSTPVMKYIDKAIDDAVLERKTKKEKGSSKVKIPFKKSTAQRKQKRTPAFISKPRNKQGQFTSVMGIQAILDAKIKEKVADNMGKGGALVYRTGRFADSVSVDKVMQSRQGTLTAFYTYMKAPYQTFERGFKQGSLRRDPRKLISSSIREIARENLSHKLHIRTRRV
jgi:hypothetical protein